MLNNLPQRFQQQLQFIIEIDKLKKIIRRSPLMDGSRKENDAEHSWHLAMMAMVLAEYAEKNVNIFRVLKMLLIHDLVEIDAGDVFLYDANISAATKHENEHKAAQRIYGLLPTDLENEFLELWIEFEKRETPDAKFAFALDRLQPLLHNYLTEGGTWIEFQISAKAAREKIYLMKEGSELIGKLAELLIESAVEKGYLTV